MKKDLKNNAGGASYSAPELTVVNLVVEQCCLTSSVKDTLQDMQGNSIYDEEF